MAAAEARGLNVSLSLNLYFHFLCTRAGKALRRLHICTIHLGHHCYSKTCLKQPPKNTQKLVFNTDYRLMQAKSIAECSKGSILQYFRPFLSYHFPLRPLFCLFLSGHLRQVLLSIKISYLVLVHFIITLSKHLFWVFFFIEMPQQYGSFEDPQGMFRLRNYLIQNYSSYLSPVSCTCVYMGVCI